MTNHPNRSASNLIKWRRTTRGSLIATWPNGDEWIFSRPGGGYVYCDLGSRHRSGTLGIQICRGGHTTGSTIYETDDAAFEKAVKKWLADYRRNEI